MRTLIDRARMAFMRSAVRILGPDDPQAELLRAKEVIRYLLSDEATVNREMLRRCGESLATAVQDKDSVDELRTTAHECRQRIADLQGQLKRARSDASIGEAWRGHSRRLWRRLNAIQSMKDIDAIKRHVALAIADERNLKGRPDDRQDGQRSETGGRIDPSVPTHRPAAGNGAGEHQEASAGRPSLATHSDESE
jgi:uncharacterized membrane protein YccC